MPIYEYRCDTCDNEFEKLVRPGADEPTVCPECSSETLSRLISNTSFKLKGTGWYETDYADGGSSGGSDVEAETASDDVSETAEVAEET